MQLKNTLLILTISLFIVACSSNEDFTIEKGKVGKITKKTTIKELDKIFENDSLVSNLAAAANNDSFFQDEDEYILYDEKGKLLLTIVPVNQADSTSIIKSIEIHDERYTTENGLSLNSKFADINANNKIDRIETTLQSATLFIDDLNATIVIDKQELGLADFTSQTVTKEQIPDLAKIKSFIIWFE
ncbi:MAG: hypothetical protein HC798_02720 [Polaribacter sp.]|nr:hypothetical protein [Polaribacter sp.]